MSQNSLRLLQSALIFLQIINAGIAGETSIPHWLPLVLAAAIGGIQFYVHGTAADGPGTGANVPPTARERAIMADIPKPPGLETEK